MEGCSHKTALLATQHAVSVRTANAQRVWLTCMFDEHCMSDFGHKHEACTLGCIQISRDIKRRATIANLFDLYSAL